MSAIEDQIRALVHNGVVVRKQIEATIGRKLSEDERKVFDKELVVRRLRLNKKKALGPMSTAERVKKHVAGANELGDISLKIRHPRLRERCRYNLELFGWTYCRSLLRHRPPERLRCGLIESAQNAILYGGMLLKEYGRGGGKTTWLSHIAPIWSALYGHRHFIVGISVNKDSAKLNLKAVKKILLTSKAIHDDFPEVGHAIREINGVSQRAANQTYHGASTLAEWAKDRIVLPMLRDASGQPLGPGCGAIIAAAGIRGGIRGANDTGARPDLVMIDDPQDRKIAHSPKETKRVLDYIHEDVLQLSDHSRSITAFVAITPQCFGDVATEMSDPKKYPQWSVTIEPFVTRLPPNFEDLVDEFGLEFAEDRARNDVGMTRSRAWYEENRERFLLMEVLDPFQFDPILEVDAIHHVLNQRMKLGERAFNAELMLKISDVNTELNVSADLVSKALNGYPRGVLPRGTNGCVAFADLNIQKSAGISWGVVAFGPGRVGAVVAYGRYPASGALVPPGSSELQRNRLVAAGIREVINTVANLKLRDALGRRVYPKAMAFDRGYLPDVVHRTLDVVRKTKPMNMTLVAMRGFPWNKFGTRKKDMVGRGDHLFATRSQYGQYLAEMAPYWREVMLSGFLETPLMAGSLSLYGKSAVDHYEFASEVAAERLIRKYLTPRGDMAWDWATGGANHYCDVLTGAYALASWFRLYDKLSSVIDDVAKDGLKAHSAHQDDLFDPRLNPSIVEVKEAEVDDEGTGVAVAPHESEVMNEKDPFLDASDLPLRPIVRRKMSKFKRGKYK